FAIRARLRSTTSSSTTATGVMMFSVAARIRSTFMRLAPRQMGKAAIERESIEGIAVPTFYRIGRDEGVEGRLLRCLGDGLEDLVKRGALRPELAFDQDVDRVGSPRRRAR